MLGEKGSWRALAHRLTRLGYQCGHEPMTFQDLDDSYVI
jgi:hypothetical protein